MKEREGSSELELEVSSNELLVNLSNSIQLWKFFKKLDIAEKENELKLGHSGIAEIKSIRKEYLF